MEIALVFLALAILTAAVLIARRPSARPDPWMKQMWAQLAAEAEAGRVVQARLDQAASSLSSLSGAFEERRGLEEKSTAAVERIERLLAGSYSKGKMGENLLAAALDEFPPEMIERNLVVGGRVCEFALRMADGKLLPIDSKWPSTSLIEKLETCDSDQVETLRRQAEKVVQLRIKEAAQYIDPALTAPMAVVAVPDSIYGCCRKAHADARAHRIVVVSYSNAVPILLSIWNLQRAYSAQVENAGLTAGLHELAVVMNELNDRMEGHLARGLKQATNAMFEMRSLTSTARSLLVRLTTPDESAKNAVEFESEAV
ncbi:MAG TPA: DNA recombination protein RmuC [Actinomycetota bacterium]|nr:DNA recombination protein RmuC [Actinomycetota bacterium]